ncbi:hypothetical protein Salat_0704900 [Sesamum alatum]|uniref:Late embryogenesis abundant protein LEA-2 subgroup domain-containing protein n=1 Tax=Sesamum alatum TaxID=300844 RepID=A0AAE1YS33_9LAMI|nr:hypothetical protein Salat_0704900 [Sesamum alatum]
MAEKKEQVKPLAPAAHRINIHDEEAAVPLEFATGRHGKCIKCCGCSAAVLLILATMIIILMFTILRVKDPVLEMNSVKIDGLSLLYRNAAGFHPGLNLTFAADVSIKNPNVASFKFDNTTTFVYYDGAVVGEVKSPGGQARARRTLGMNVTIDVAVDKVLEVGRFKSDFDAGIFPLSTYTRISGKVRITDMIKRSVVVKMNCTMNVNMSSQGVQDRICRRRVSL